MKCKILFYFKVSLGLECLKIVMNYFVSFYVKINCIKLYKKIHL